MKTFYEEKISNQAKRKKFNNLDTLTVNHVDKLKTVMRYQEINFREKSNCLEAANTVTFFLTGEVVFSPNEEIFSVPMDKFFSKKGSIFSYKIVEDLLTSSKQAEHSIFHIEFGRSLHSLVIEKECNEKMTLFKIYQSWIYKFTLTDWLEEKGEYSYTELELIKFIEDTINEIYEENRLPGCYSFFCCKKISVDIRKFKFDAHFLERNYQEIYAKQSLQNKF